MFWFVMTRMTAHGFFSRMIRLTCKTPLLLLWRKSLFTTQVCVNLRTSRKVGTRSEMGPMATGNESELSFQRTITAPRPMGRRRADSSADVQHDQRRRGP